MSYTPFIVGRRLKLVDPLKPTASQRLKMISGKVVNLDAHRPENQNVIPISRKPAEFGKRKPTR
ncbi:MAG: hypothetical protein ACKO0Z_25175 [Betaproteobacteria bacterium]